MFLYVKKSALQRCNMKNKNPFGGVADIFTVSKSNVYTYSCLFICFLCGFMRHTTYYTDASQIPNSKGLVNDQVIPVTTSNFNDWNGTVKKAAHIINGHDGSIYSCQNLMWLLIIIIFIIHEIVYIFRGETAWLHANTKLY